MNIVELMDAFHGLILAHVQGVAAPESHAPFLAFEPGTPIPDETFHAPPDNPEYSPAVALEYLSHHANVAPRVSQGLFVHTGNTVEGQYEVLLFGSTPVNGAGLELFGRIRRAADAAFDETLGSSVAPGIGRFRPVHADPINWYDQSAAGNWTTFKIDGADLPRPASTSSLPENPALFKWRIAPEPVRELLGAPVSMQTVHELAGAAPDGQLAIGRITSPPDAPARDGKPDAAALGRALARLPRDLRRVVEMDINGLTIEEIAGALRLPASTVRSRLARGQAFLEAALAPPQPPSPPPAPAEEPVSSDGFSLSLELCVVHLRRQWLSEGLLALRGWFVPSFARGEFSGGRGAEDAGRLAVLPIACVFIRNLTIKAQWSEADAANAETSSHLGAFSLLGRRFDQNRSSLTVPGMQGVAWLCAPMPVLPPADPPAA